MRHLALTSSVVAGNDFALGVLMIILFYKVK